MGDPSLQIISGARPQTLELGDLNQDMIFHWMLMLVA